MWVSSLHSHQQETAEVTRPKEETVAEMAEAAMAEATTAVEATHQEETLVETSKAETIISSSRLPQHQPSKEPSHWEPSQEMHSTANWSNQWNHVTI